MVFGLYVCWFVDTTGLSVFSPRPGASLLEAETLMQDTYPAPMASDFTISPYLMEPGISRDNYRPRMHNILHIEEMAQFSKIAKFVYLRSEENVKIVGNKSCLQSAE